MLINTDLRIIFQHFVPAQVGQASSLSLQVNCWQTGWKPVLRWTSASDSVNDWPIQVDKLFPRSAIGRGFDLKNQAFARFGELCHMESCERCCVRLRD
jgi:hypothetical protein